MTRLADLHKRLARLQRRRQRVRWETAYSALLLAVLWILGAIFLIDWLVVHVVFGSFLMGSTTTPLQRVLLLIVGVGVAVWAFRRYTLPWLGQQETELDMALLVEREERIDSDLVAAVQFESPEAPQWGSVQLEQAVIEDVATRGGRINVMRGLSRKELSRRSKLLLVTAIVWVLVAVCLSGHVRVFFNRLLLGSKHYPTRTRIESIAISGHDIQNPTHPDSTPSKPLMLTYGEPLKFEVCGKGSFPEKGTARLAASRSGLRTAITLLPAGDEEAQPAGGNEEIRMYVAELPRLVDSVRYQIFLGDAWTEPGYLGVGQLPNVELQLEVEPPAYATTGPKAGPVAMQRGLRQISVVEGSRVRVNIYSDKPLQNAILTISEQEYSLKCADSEASPQQWVLDPKGTPLSAVTEPVRYSLQVTDTDGLRLEQPIEGTVRIQADSPPRIAAAVVTQLVLPSAKPTVYLHAVDDYGLARISIAHKVIGAGGESAEGQSDIYKLPAGKSPEKNIEKTYSFDLSSLELKKGDRVEVVLRAVDFRGPREGKTASAETLVFEVTDEAGILEHLTEKDRRSVRQLKTMIQRQLGIGESP